MDRQVDGFANLATPTPETGLPTSSGDDMYIHYTGGMTGMPKAVR